MAESFDPYRVWLGIPPEEQPPNYYRLLGVGLFESDPDVIASAADRQMAHVRTFQNGPRAVLSQEMLNELSAANVCLLKADKRAEYEKLLRSKLETEQMASGESPPTQAPVVGVPVDDVNPSVPPLVIPPTATDSAQGVSVGDAAVDISAGAPAKETAKQSDAAPVVVTTSANESTRRKPAATAAAKRSAGSRSSSATAKTSTSRSPTSRPATRNKSSKTPLIAILGGVGALLLVLLITFGIMSGGSNDKGKKIADSGQRKLPNRADRSKSRRSKSRPPRRQKTAPKTSQPSTPPKKEPGDAKPKVDSGPISPISPGKQIQLALDAAKTALRGRDATKADKQLKQARSLGLSAEQSREVAHLEQLTAHLSEFWKLASDGVRRLKVDQTITLAGQEAKVTAIDKDKSVTIDQGGKSRIIELSKLRDLPALELVDLAERAVGPNDAFSKLYLATFLQVDQPSGTSAAGKRSSDLIAEVASAGVDTKQLAESLQILAAKSSPDGSTQPVKSPSNPPPPSPQKIDWTRFPFAVRASAKPKRPEKPAASVLSMARARVRRIYKNEFLRARQREEKDELAGKLIQQANAATDDPTLRYVLLQEAHDLAIDVPNGGRLMAIIDQMAEVYDVDVLGMKSVALTKATGKTSDRVVLKDLLEHARAVYRQAEAARRFDVAAHVVRTARTMAKKGKDLQAGRELDQRVRQLEVMEKSYSAAVKAAVTLAKSQQDPAASLTMGRYLIGIEGDWKRGLQTLANGSDANLAQLAQADLSNPPNPDEQVDLGDKWSALAKRTGTSKSPNVFLFRRAREWYVRALGKLKSIEKVKIQQRIEEIDAVLGAN